VADRGDDTQQARDHPDVISGMAGDWPILGDDTQQAREAALRDATEKLIEATHVGQPWQISSAQTAWDKALAALVAERDRYENALREAQDLFRRLDETAADQTQHESTRKNANWTIGATLQLRTAVTAALAGGVGE
jgi:hypothetical protein